MRVVARIGTSILVSSVLAVGACAQDDAAQEAAVADRQVAECLAEAGYGSSLENFHKRRLEDPELDEAVENCLQQVGAEGPEPGEAIRIMDDRVRTVVKCLRGEGWDVPDPDRGADGVLSYEGLDAGVPEDRYADFRADLDMCLADQ